MLALYLAEHIHCNYTLSEAWSGVNWADLMAAQGAFGTDFYDRSILRPKHRAYHRSNRPVIKTGPKRALGSHEIRSIHSSPSLGQSIVTFGTKHGPTDHKNIVKDPMERSTPVKHYTPATTRLLQL